MRVSILAGLIAAVAAAPLHDGQQFVLGEGRFGAAEAAKATTPTLPSTSTSTPASNLIDSIVSAVAELSHMLEESAEELVHAFESSDILSVDIHELSPDCVCSGGTICCGREGDMDCTYGICGL